MRRINKIEIDESQAFQSYLSWQSLYMDHTTGMLLPNTEIWSGERLLLRINSLGCKGEELLRDVPVMAFLGDSATFCVSRTPKSWPGFVSVAGFQSLNAAVEGYGMAAALQRYQTLSTVVPFAAVVVYVGWHNIIYNDNPEQYWASILDQFAGSHVLAFCTLATCLRDECVERGIETLLRTQSPREGYANYFEYNDDSLNTDYFNFWCNMKPSTTNVRKVLYGVRRYNEWLKRYCAGRGHILLDLHSLLAPNSFEQIPELFFDVCHPRPRAYRAIADYVSRALAPALDRRGGGMSRPHRDLVPEKSEADMIHRDAPSGSKAGCGAEDIRSNVYPLW
jgi:hypothetical protein